MKPFRYYDEARTFGESLAEIKVAEPVKPEPNVGALDRILSGETALSKMADERAMAHASAPEEMQKHELKKKLHALLDEKQKRAAAVRAGVDVFLARAEKVSGDLADHYKDRALAVQDMYAPRIKVIADAYKGRAAVVRGAAKALKEKIANPTMTDVTPGMMTSGNGQLIPQPEMATDSPQGMHHQGPAANLLARALKHHNAGNKSTPLL
jgi:hypothetical protein